MTRAAPAPSPRELRRRQGGGYRADVRSADTRIVERPPIMAGQKDDAREILVMIHGAQIGHKFNLDRARGRVVMGREVDVGICVDDDSVSRRHCQIIWEDDAWYVEDLGSTNGTYVSGAAVTRVPVADGDLIKLGSTILKYLSTDNVEAAYHEEIYRMAIFDGLTQIHNRRYLLEFTEREIARCQRHQRALSLVIFDVDHFKNVNDQYGHLSGDYVLRTLARRVQRRVRREELFARYAGDEFVLVLPETPADAAFKFAEAVRSLVAETDFTFDGQPLPVTISAGVGSLSLGMSAPDELVAAADAALYRAKENGRNNVAL